MRRRLNDWASLKAAAATARHEPDPVQNAKRQLVDAVCAKLEDVNTFTSIGRIVGFSRQYVSKHMQQHFTEKDWFRIGDEYRIPRATAERFIREHLYRL